MAAIDASPVAVEKDAVVVATVEDCKILGGVAPVDDGGKSLASVRVCVERISKSPLARVVEEKEPPRRKTVIQDLASECVVSILEFLRAVDMCSVSEVDRTVFSPGRLRLGISFQLNHVSFSRLFQLSPLPPPPQPYPLPFVHHFF